LKEYSNSFEKTLKNTDLQNVSIDLAEVAIDQLINDGVFKDIPILGTIYGVGKAALQIREILFLKKIIYFLTEIKDVPPYKREQMVETINTSEKFRTKVGEKLLFIIDRCEDYEKAQIIAKLFKAFINETIDYNDFLRSSSIVDRIMIEDLYWFVNHEVEGEMFYELDDLISTGLLTFTVEDQSDRDLKLPSKYELRAYVSDIGSKIRKVLKET
jgi:hypothetical protein